MAGLGAGLENDALDETAQRICRLMAIFGMVECIGKARNLAAVNVSDVSPTLPIRGKKRIGSMPPT